MRQWQRWPNLRGEHGGAGSDAPGHHRLADPALPDALADLVLLHATNLCFQAQMADKLQGKNNKKVWREYVKPSFYSKNRR